MNQILSTDGGQRQDKERINNYNNKNSSNTTLDLKKIIIIFLAVLIIFALIIVVIKVYGIIKEKNKNSNKENLNKPTITIEETGDTCTILVQYDDGLDMVTYWWNDDNNFKQNNQNGSDKFSVEINIPEGEKNTLYVSAVGSDQSKNDEKHEFTSNKQTDQSKPTITINQIGEKIEIIAKSDIGMKSLSYKWEDEDEQTIVSTEENQTEIVATTPVTRTVRTLYIIATDVNGNTEEKQESIGGVYNPVVDMKIYQEGDKNTLKIKVSHDKGFKQIIMKVNDAQLIYDENYPEYTTETTELSTELELNEGHIKVEVTVYTLEQPDTPYTTTQEADI